jgi:hypothetical protein
MAVLEAETQTLTKDPAEASRRFNLPNDPLENLELVADPEKNFVMIMKDGEVYKNRQ